MQFQFTCNQCGVCCSYYKIVITLTDALRIFHHTKKPFRETFCFYTEAQLTSPPENMVWFTIDTCKKVLGIISSEAGCIFLKNNVCSIHDFKPGLCYFYPVTYTGTPPSFFQVTRHDICRGDYENGLSDWPGIKVRYAEYSAHQEWHARMAEYWNTYYREQNSEKDFIIYFYERLYPLFLAREQQRE